MFGILIAIHVLITVLLIFVVLVQKSEGGSSLFASGAGNGMFTARGTSDILTKSTWILATVFLCNCILMAHISSKHIKDANSIVVNSELKKYSAKRSKQNVNTSSQSKSQKQVNINSDSKPTNTKTEGAKKSDKTSAKPEKK